MERSLTTIIDSLSSKARHLVSQRESLKEENADLKEEIARLKGTIDEDMNRIASLEKEVEFLKLSHRLADSPEALIESRRIVAALIRKIDRCITLLNDDAEI